LPFCLLVDDRAYGQTEPLEKFRKPLVLEQFVKLSKKVEHCLFVEEESYNWAPAQSGISKGALVLMALTMLAAVVVLTQLR